MNKHELGANWPPADCMIALKDQAAFPDRLAAITGLESTHPTIAAAREEVRPVPSTCPHRATSDSGICGASATLPYEQLMGAGGKLENTHCLALAIAALRGIDRPLPE